MLYFETIFAFGFFLSYFFPSPTSISTVRTFIQKERRRVSIEGERMAKKVVDNIAGEHLRDSHEEKVYYRYCSHTVVCVRI